MKTPVPQMEKFLIYGDREPIYLGKSVLQEKEEWEEMQRLHEEEALFELRQAQGQ